MNLLQSIKFAWRSIRGKKGRSVLTILSVFIGIASVMTIVSVMEGMKDYTRQMYSSMGSNRITVGIYSWVYDNEGNPITTDYYSGLYNYCLSISDLVDGITPNGYCNATVSYGTKSSDTMQYEYDDNWNLISGPPSKYYGSEQYAICNNLELAKGRDISYVDVKDYHQVCVLGSDVVKNFFGSVDPVGKMMQFNGNNFEVIGVYSSRSSDNSAISNSNMDNFIVVPYTASRLLGGEVNQYIVKAKDSDSMKEAITSIGSYLKTHINPATAGYDVYSESSWQESENELLTTIGLILGGIAAISLLVGGIGIMNIMLVSVTERTREIGIRRAIGATKSSIVVQFLVEAGMLCGIGGVVGIAIGYVGSILIGRAILDVVIYPPVWVTVVTLLFSISLGLLFGSYPASKAAKLQPVEALRAE